MWLVVFDRAEVRRVGYGGSQNVWFDLGIGAGEFLEISQIPGTFISGFACHGLDVLHQKEQVERIGWAGFKRPIELPQPGRRKALQKLIQCALTTIKGLNGVRIGQFAYWLARLQTQPSGPGSDKSFVSLGLAPAG